MNTNEEMVSASQVLEAFKDALRAGVKCGLILEEEFQDTEYNDRKFFEQQMR